MADIVDVEGLTIRDVFALPLDSPPELAAGLKPEDFKQLEKKLSSLSQPIGWSVVQSQVAGVFSGALNTRVLDGWASAWTKYKDLKQDAEDSRKAPEAVVLSRLAEHSIESSLHPYVEVFLGSKMVQKIVFDVTLTTQLEGLLLELKNGCIVSIQLAKCEWKGSIATQAISLIERPLAKLNLPGRITLKHAIPLTSKADN